MSVGFFPQLGQQIGEKRHFSICHSWYAACVSDLARTSRQRKESLASKNAGHYMEQIFNSHGAFGFMLLGLCGDVAGFKAGLWAFGVLCLVSMSSVLVLALREQRQWFVRTHHRPYATTSSLPSVLSVPKQQKVTNP